MVYCCVPLCKSSGRTAASRGISFHEFPITDVRNLWLKNIHLALNVMQSVEDAGFRVVRLVGDNHKSNTKFFSSLSGGQIQPVVEHPLDAGRPLFLSFDYCHIIKNIRSQFLDAKKISRNQGKLILPDFLWSQLWSSWRWCKNGLPCTTFRITFRITLNARAAW
nr:uncharacterized protein LOC119177371 [Rhipicephalus microplus]